MAIHPPPPSDPGPSAKSDIRLRILHSTDLHGALRGYDYLADKPSASLGLTRTATLIRAARAEAPANLLFDTGDVLQGSPVCDLAAETGLAPGTVHPMIAAMNALGYDAFTPGNHDFNHGAAFLFRALSDAAFPVVSANFLHADGTPVFAPHTILTRDLPDISGQMHRLRIAVIGCLPPQTIDWDHALAADYRTEDMLASVSRALAALSGETCDLTVLLAHTGIDPGPPANRAENALLPLAALEGVDLVLGGHTHLPFPSARAPAHPAIDAARGTIHGTPVLMSGFGGSHLGQADLRLSPDGAGGWRLASAQCTLLPLACRDAQGRIMDTVPEDKALLAASRTVHRETLRHIRTPLGETRQPLHSFFSLLSNDASVQLIARAQASQLRRRISGTPLADLPLLSAAAPFKSGRRGGPEHFTHVPAGPFTRRALTDLYAYENTLCALRVTGAQLREWLEHSASLFSQIAPGEKSDTPLLIESFPGYKFDIVCGLTYEIDLTAPPRYDSHNRLADPSAHRIRALCHHGAPVPDEQAFLVATNSYRVHGTGFPEPAPDIVFEAPVSNRDLLAEHIREHPALDISARPVWSFSPLGGATALFETSPRARAYLGDPQLPLLEDMGNTPEGFARFRVTL